MFERGLKGRTMLGRDAVLFLGGFLAVIVGYGPLSTASTPRFNEVSVVNIEAISDRENRTFQKKSDEIIRRLMGLGKRCVDRTDTCPYYYDGYFYETPWWTAPAIY
jgi:hypothetical protein